MKLFLSLALLLPLVANAQPKPLQKRIVKESQRLQVAHQIIDGLIPPQGGTVPPEVADAYTAYELTETAFAVVVGTGDTNKDDYDKLDHMIELTERAVRVAAAASLAPVPVRQSPTVHPKL